MKSSKKNKRGIFAEFDRYFDQNNLGQLFLRVSCSSALSNKFFEYLKFKTDDNNLKKFVEFCSLTEDGAAYLYNSQDHRFIGLCIDRNILDLQSIFTFFKEHQENYTYIHPYENICKCLQERRLSTKEALQQLLQLVDNERDDAFDEDSVSEKFVQLDQLLSYESLMSEILKHDLLTYSRIKEYDEVILKQANHRPIESWYMTEIKQDPSITLNVLKYYIANPDVLKELDNCQLAFKCSTSDVQFLDMLNMIRSSEKASSTLRQIVDSNLHSQYDFVELKKLITKDDNKKKLKLNF